MTAVAGILLAAGPSSRLGRDKQLLRLRGRTFLRGAAEALASVASPRVAVLPAARPEFLGELDGLDFEPVLNPDPGAGMGDSLALGAAALGRQERGFDLVLVALVDQPLVDRSLFERLAAAAVAAGGWAACDYGDGAWGAPACFPASALPDLAALAGDRGARALLEERRAAGGLAWVDFPAGRLDVDTEADYASVRATFGVP